MHVTRLLPLALLLSAAPVLAQTPDTTAAARYVPLAVGNEWHTSGEHNNGYWTEAESWRYVVESEQPAAPGRFAVRWTRLYRQFPTSAPVLTTGASVWAYNAATQQAAGSAMPGAPCPLGAPFGAPVACGSQGTYQVSGGPGQTVSIGGQTVAVTRKVFSQSGSGSTYIYSIRYEYAAGIGQTLYEQSRFVSNDSSRDSWRLVYARVGGAEYGQPLIFPSGSGDVPAAEALDLRVWPNPASSAATARFTLAAPATVHLTVTDALGRDIITAERTLGAGAQALGLDAARLAPGLYVLRLRAGAVTGTQHVTVAR